MYHDTDREERSSMIEMTEAENDSLGEMTEAEYGVLGEAAEAEYGICDLLDENIPSPLEMDNAGEKLVLPEIQDMTEYIRRHYEQEIMKKLAWRLRWEELCVVSDGKYYQDLPWTGSEDYGEEVSLPDPEDVIPKDFDDPCFADEKTRYATLQPKEVKIVFASYYRVSECCVEARLTVEAQVEIRWRFLGKTVPQRYDVDMWFDMEGDMNGEICQIALHRYRSEASGVKLDEYLVPVFHWEDIEEEAERIIADLVPEGLSDPSRLRPYPFAERLGLKIVSLPLYKRPKTASILFFGPGDVLTGSSEDAPSVSVAVEANTIVLNSHLSGREKDAIFHECFHYVEHRLFFKLQQLHNNDIAAIGRWRPVTLKEGRRSPIEWIEWQANVGSQCLQVPQALLRKCVNEALNDMKNIRLHMGYRLQIIGKRLAREFDVWNYRLRNRMIHVGYSAARGALNYVRDGYIQPFAFDLSKCHGGQTFVITPNEMIAEYIRNEAFRRLIDTGHYIYVDGHICINDPEYVVLSNGKLLLTPWANQHVDQCCLRFVRTYHRDRKTHYVFGQLNSDEEYNGRSLSMSASERAPRLYEQAVARAQLIQSLPGSFHAAFAMLMDAKGITVEKLAEETMLSERSITRYRNREQDSFSADTVAILCLGLGLDPILSFAMMEKAGIHLRDTPEDLTLKAVLMGLHTTPVMQVRAYLNEINYPRIRLWPQQQ